MPTHEFWERVASLAAWRAGHAPALAAAIAVALAMLGRWTRRPLLAAAATGIGLAIGMALLAGWAMLPRTTLQRLPLAVAVALAGGLLADSRRLRRWRWAVVVMLATGGGCWLAGVSLRLTDMRAAAPVAVGIAAYLMATAALLARCDDAWQPMAAALALYAALHLAGGPSLWSLLPLVVLAAGAGQFGQARGTMTGALPLAAGLAGAALLPELGAGRLLHGGAGRIEFAAAAPLAVLALAPWVRARFPALGGLPAAFVALATAGLLLWMAGGLAHIR